MPCLISVQKMKSVLNQVFKYGNQTYPQSYPQFMWVIPCALPWAGMVAQFCKKQAGLARSGFWNSRSNSTQV
jgi:hypothetical protein